jgi:putative N6-adenine-specific DNA methylase
MHGLEPLLANELVELGAETVQEGKRAVTFEGDKALMYRANLSLRTALRILKPIGTFRAQEPSQLYNELKKIDWSEYLSVRNTFVIDAIVNRSRYFNHSQFVAQKSKDAIVDQFRENEDDRPSVNTYDPDIRINVHIAEDECTVSLDSSGDSLHKRGYRIRTGEAPINEVLAAGIVMHSGWDGKAVFQDPMCGSGTLLIEAAMIAANKAPNINRKQFGFMPWKDFDQDLFDEIKADLEQKERKPNGAIEGYDSHFGSISVSRANIENAGLSDYITLDRSDFFRRQHPSDGMFLVFNPPYGERMKLEESEFYKKLGDVFKQHFAGCTAWLITSDMENAKHIGLRPSRRIGLFNGKLECKLFKFEMYAGTKKVHKHNDTTNAQ